MGGWLAGLDALVTGTAYLFALLAARFVLRPLLLVVLGSAPFVGGWLTSHVDQAFSAFERQINPAAEASLGIWVSALSWLVTQGWNFANSAGDLADGVYAALHTLVTVTLPHAGGLAEQYLEGLIEDARAFALLQVQAAEARLQVEVALVEGEGRALVDQARSEALSEVSAAERVVLQEIRKAEQATGQLFQQAEYDAQQVAQGAEQRAVALVEQARAAAAQGIGAVESDLQRLAQATGTLIEDSTAVIREDLTAGQAQTKQALDAAETRLQEEIDAVIKSGPWAVAVAAYQGGEAALKSAVSDLVRAGLAQARAELADVEALRTKYAPQIAAALELTKQGAPAVPASAPRPRPQ